MATEKRTDVVLPTSTNVSAANKYYASGSTSVIPGSAINPNRYVRARKRYYRSDGRTTAGTRKLPTLQLLLNADLEPVVNQIVTRFEEGVDVVKVDVSSQELNDQLESRLDEIAETHRTVAAKKHDVLTHITGVDSVVGVAENQVPSATPIKHVEPMPGKSPEAAAVPVVSPITGVVTADTDAEEEASELAEAKAAAKDWVAAHADSTDAQRQAALETLKTENFTQYVWVKQQLDS